MSDLRIRTQVLLAVLAGLLLTAAASALLVRATLRRQLTHASEQAVRRAHALHQELERGDVHKLSAAMEAIASRPDLQEAFQARDRERLLAAAAPLFARLRAEHGITHWYFLEAPPSQRCFLRVHAPAKWGDRVERPTFQQAIATGRQGAGKELGQTAFALRVVKPWFIGGQLAGYLELGEEIDAFLARMKAETGDDYGLVVDKGFLNRAEWAATRAGRADGWDEAPDAVLVDATSPDVRPAALASRAGGEGRLGELKRDGRTFVTAAFPVSDAGGRVVGRLAVQHEVTELRGAALAGGLRLVGLVMAVMVAMAAGLVFLLDRLVFRRLARMTWTLEDAALRLAGGDTSVAERLPPPARQDEIGEFEGFFGSFLRLVANTFQDLTDRKTGT